MTGARGTNLAAVVGSRRVHDAQEGRVTTARGQRGQIWARVTAQRRTRGTAAQMAGGGAERWGRREAKTGRGRETAGRASAFLILGGTGGQMQNRLKTEVKANKSFVA